MFLTFKYRVKDASSRRHLIRHARACNFVWNYCCQTQQQAERRWKSGGKGRWPTAFDMIKLCTGASAELGLHSDTVQAICRQFTASRDGKHRCPRFRASSGPRRALGWIPFVPRALKVDGAQAVYLKRKFRFWQSRELGGAFKSGSFTQDARGRWYIAFQREVETDRPTGTGEIGIDLGLKRFATLTDRSTIPSLQHYRRYEAALAVASRARNNRRIRAIHAKITNTRRHHLHEWSTKIARENELIVVGNVNAAKLGKTRMAKSVYDASWSMFRYMLRYKASRHGARYVEADEAWTSATCSSCGARSGPKGIAGLRVRHWECSVCGSTHQRDLNAALNILRVGRERPPPAVEIAA